MISKELLKFLNPQTRAFDWKLSEKLSIPTYSGKYLLSSSNLCYWDKLLNSSNS